MEGKKGGPTTVEGICQVQGLQTIQMAMTFPLN